jgi:hypothetical protein
LNARAACALAAYIHDNRTLFIKRKEFKKNLKNIGITSRDCHLLFAYPGLMPL